MYDNLGVVVSGCSFTSDHDYTWLELVRSLVGWCFLNLHVPPDTPQEIQQLPLVLVNSLNLNVVKRVEGNIISSVIFDPLL